MKALKKDTIAEWQVFESLSRTRSVTQTADELGIKPSSVTAHLQRLEAICGQKLLRRDTRPFTLTHTAVSIAKDVSELLSAHNHIERIFAEKADEGSAILRIMVGNSFRRFAPRLLVHYAKQHPNLHINVIAPIDINEFLAEKADIIAVSGQVVLPDTVMLPRGRMISVPIASPAYIKEHGEIQHPSELKNHRIFSNLYENRYSFKAHYPLQKGEEMITFSGIETIRLSSVDMVLQAVRDSLGVSPSVPLFHCIDDLERGTVVPVLNGWHRPCRPNYIVCRKSDWNIGYIRDFMHWWSEELTAIETAAENRFESLFGRELLDEYRSPLGSD